MQCLRSALISKSNSELFLTSWSIIDYNIWYRRRLHTDTAALSPSATELQRAKIIERRNVLQRKIEGWISVQQLYMPYVTARREQWISTQTQSTAAEVIPLFLPSAISSESETACSKKTQEYEWRLRIAQAYDALNSLRDHLCLRAHMYKYKDRFVTGQRQNTRARSTIGYVEAKINSDTTRYRVAYMALTILGPILQKVDWQESLKALKHDDIRSISQGADGSTEGTRSLSWIWMTEGIGMNAEQRMQDGMF